MSLLAATITVRFTQSGYHRWDQAPRSRAYLRQRHRHLFHVSVTTPVRHLNRELEFHDLIDAATQELRMFCDSRRGETYNFGNRSCEDIASGLATRLRDVYDRSFTVSVFEDGECGATASS